MYGLNKRQFFSLAVISFVSAAFGGSPDKDAYGYNMYHHLYNHGMLHLTIIRIEGIGTRGNVSDPSKDAENMVVFLQAAFLYMSVVCKTTA